MKYIAIYILIVGCSSRVEPDNTLRTDLSQCRYSSSDIESKHATLSAKRQGGALVNCFKPLGHSGQPKLQAVVGSKEIEKGEPH